MDRPKRIAAAAAAAAASLPDDALVEILSRVPARSLCRFKCVSRTWCDLIADRLRCTRLPQALEGFFYAYDDGDDEGEGGEHFINTVGEPSPLSSFSFLTKVPGIEEFGLLRSCNGLLLFTHRKVGDTYNSLGYIVCNPATEQWVAVPSSGYKPDYYYNESEDTESDTESTSNFTYLVFNPAASSHFQLVEFWTDDAAGVQEVHTYSSETEVWCHRTNPWSDEAVSFASEIAFVSGMLHLSATSFAGWQIDHELIVVVDGKGKNCRIIRGPENRAEVAFLGQSQGCLHYMNQHRDSTYVVTELSIWVLKDYDTEDWVLKHSVTFLKLFGRRSCRFPFYYKVIAIHPDRNLIFFFQRWDLKLKSYDMDSQEVCTLRTLGAGRQNVLPYVPYFAELSALSSKH